MGQVLQFGTKHFKQVLFVVIKAYPSLQLETHLLSCHKKLSPQAEQVSP